MGKVGDKRRNGRGGAQSGKRLQDLYRREAQREGVKVGEVGGGLLMEYLHCIFCTVVKP